MNNLNNMSFSIYLPAKSFKGTHNNTIIEGSFESGSFEGHLFFNGNWIQAKLLNHYKNYERTLKCGMKTNQRVKNLLEFYEWLPAYGTQATKEHYGEQSFNSKLKLFKEAGFNQNFLDIMNDYYPIECPKFRQWTFLFKFRRRPLTIIDLN
ncbi:hypothetical protein [Acinetobacter pittii]|uniref:hypothetical protein n=1 Tax=Acinetobacter pittii TaxID=48296 RepID=UPI0021CD635E|nr:hypothetical protein [Acinetobacter pittii]MCU4707680.1 hypothetical protein [Acinetobacter pittii]